MWPGRGSRLFTTEIIIAAFATLIATCKCPTTAKRTLIGTTSCIPLPSIWTQITLGTIASFMSGLFATNVLNRWWATQESDHAHIGVDGGPSADQCTRIVRLLNFAHVLLFQTVRGRTSLKPLARTASTPRRRRPSAQARAFAAFASPNSTGNVSVPVGGNVKFTGRTNFIPQP